TAQPGQTGTLDAALASKNGFISAADGGNTLQSLSTQALSLVSQTNDINVSARTSILFDNTVGAMKLGGGKTSAGFFVQTGDLSFANPASTLAVSGGGIDIEA